MDNRRLILAVVLSFGVLALWSWVFPPKKPQPLPEVPPAVEQSTGGASPSAASPSSTSVPAGEEAAPAGEPLTATAEQQVTLETDEAVATFSNRGAQLLSYKLKQHKTAADEPLDLVRHRAEGPYPFALVNGENASLPINQALFVVEPDGATPPRTVTFRYNGPEGRAEKSFAFSDKGLLHLDVTYTGSSRWGVLLGPGVSNPTVDELGSRLSHRSLVYRLGGEVKRTYAQQTPKQQEIPGGALSWVGLEDNYFLGLAIVETPLRSAVATAVALEPAGSVHPGRFAPLPATGEVPKDEKDWPRDYMLRLDPQGPRVAAQLYLGAKELAKLTQLGQDLDRTIDLGRLRFLALPFLLALRWIHDHVVGNYGWAIVLLTILIRLALLPLTHKGMASMKKMQELQPKMQAIEARYAGKLRDKQGRPNLEMQRKKQEEQMALYSSEGVNPVGGCLPMFLQFPVFIAFYAIFPVAVELRNAPWILWIHDLSARDPYYLLPIIMGAAQLGQQMMMPATGNPTQRRVMMLLPVVFTVLFAGFPSGLQLYWFTNNVFGIGQQLVYNRLRQPDKPEAGKPMKKIKA